MLLNDWMNEWMDAMPCNAMRKKLFSIDVLGL